MKNKLLLIDGNSLVYRGYYGTAYSKSGILVNSQGMPVNAILVFAKMINNFLLKYKPTHLLIAFDAGKKTFRHEQYPDYKAKRSKTPNELLVQMPLIKEMVDHMKIQRYELKGAEADDIIGTAANKFQNKGDILIVSSDKDMFQLINENTQVICPRNGQEQDEIYDLTFFKNKMNYMPSQVIDIKGLAGDASDNLPGVRGIGAKGAVKLIEEYNNLENIFANLSNFDGLLKEKLIKGEKEAKMSKQLATIKTNIDFDFDFENTLWSPKDITNALIDFFKKIEVKSLIKIFEKFLQEKDFSQKIIF